MSESPSDLSQVFMYDTTLRDGMQGIEVNFSLEDKLAIAHALDDAGIDFIEGGFPMSNEKEAAFFERVKHEHLKHAQIVAFGSTRAPGHAAHEDSHMRALVEAETPYVIVVGKTWKAHVEKVLRCSEEENLRMIHDSLSFLRSEGRRVFFDCEHFFDGFKDDPEYAIQVVQTAYDAGAESVVLCDTNGGALPSEVVEAFRAMPEGIPLGGHFHNDCGTAVANSLAAIETGATQIQGTINGWGERCGNANLCAIIPNVILKMKRPATAAPYLP
ncbi:MAG: citramalate synthase, partial [Spirochaetota bacterium]